MADDLVGKLKGLMENPDIGAQLRNLMPDGFDPSKLLDILKGNSDLLAKIQGLLPGVDVMGGLAGLVGAAGAAAGSAAGAAGDAAGAAAGAAGSAAGSATGAAKGAAGASTGALAGLLDKVKGLFRR